MTTLAVLFIFGALVGYGLKEYYQVKFGPPKSTPPAVADEIAEFLLQQSPTGRFLDMGSGWGSVVLPLAKRLPDWQIDGIEVSPTPWFIANCRSINKNFGNYSFYIGNMLKHPLQNYNVLFLNHPPRIMRSLFMRIIRLLERNVYVLTYPHPLPEIPALETLVADNNETIYLYRGLHAMSFLYAPAEPAPQTPAPATPNPLPPVPPIAEETASTPDVPDQNPNLPLNYTD